MQIFLALLNNSWARKKNSQTVLKKKIQKVVYPHPIFIKQDAFRKDIQKYEIEMTTFDIAHDTWSLTWSLPALLHFIPLLMGLRNYIFFWLQIWCKTRMLWQTQQKTRNEGSGAKWTQQSITKGTKLSTRYGNCLKISGNSGLLMIDCSLLANVPLERAKGLNSGWDKSLPQECRCFAQYMHIFH